MSPAAFRKPPSPSRVGATIGLALACTNVAAQRSDTDALLDLSLEQLANVEVTSVSRRAGRLSEAPASIYVIDREQIRRSGAVTLPELLRLAPNLQVARVSAGTYAISARGFNNSLGNKLLVLIDGRTIYTPLFSGVFWDAQDIVPEDIERIEVISGPGATLWGANAVNGVINVISRRSNATHGGLLAADVGEARSLRMRHGGALGATGHYRIYAKRDRFDASENAAGVSQPDGWERDHFGFRVDWSETGHGLGLAGAHYDGESEPRPFGPVRVSGSHLIATWARDAAEGTDLELKAYLERTERDDPLLFHDRMQVIDFELLQDRRVGRHALVWGGGYRHARDRVEAGVLTTFLPARRNLHWANVFVQDEIELDPQLALTLGLKLDRNTYTGTEVLPNLRLAWTAAPERLLWGSLSRAVRAPSRIDREFFLPAQPPFLIAGGPEFRSEISDVMEVGYRAQAGATLSYSLTAFHHRHDRLRSGEPVGDGSFQVQNGTAGRSSGLELWGELQAGERCKLGLGVVLLRSSFYTKPGFNDPDGAVDLGNDPRHWWSLRSGFEFTPQLDLQIAVRHVGALPDPSIPAYTVFDAGLLWRPRAQLELALFGRDLGGSGHAEFAPGPLVARSEFGREASLRLQWRW